MADASPDTPADPVELIAEAIRRRNLHPWKHDDLTEYRLEAEDAVSALRKAGLLVEGPLRGEASGTPAETVTEALREYRLTIGPNTRDSITAGMTRVYLSGGERHDIASIAVDALARLSRLHPGGTA